MKIKLLLDEDTQLVLAQALRKRGYDAIHIQESDRKGLSDSQQLQYAIVSERCFFTTIYQYPPRPEKYGWGGKGTGRGRASG